MKKFLKILILFLVPLVILAVVPTVVEWQVFRRAVRKPEATIGVIGDSHAACGINPAFAPQSANFAQRASQPMVWRAKLGVILDENPQIGTFMVELWTGVLTRDAEKDAKARAHFVRNHIPATALLDLYRTNEMGGLPDDNLGRNFIKGILLPFFKRPFMGFSTSALQDNYNRLDRRLVDSAWYKKGAKEPADAWGHKPRRSKTPVRAEIEDILSELQRRHIKIVLLTMPFWAHARNQLHTPADQQWFENEMTELCKKYNAKRLNLIDEFQDLENWADDSHLNTVGTERCTKLLMEHLRK